MATTLALSTMRTRLRIYLDDTGSKTWPTDSVLDMFLNHAIIKFTHDLPVSSSKVYTIDTDYVGNKHVYTLPTDLVRADHIRGYLEGTAALENAFELHSRPGVWSENDEPRGFLVDWPSEGQLYLPRQPQGSTFTLYYGAYHETWLTTDANTFDLGRNRWGELAIYAYAAYLAFNPSSSARALLEQWGRKSDLNVGNPLEEEARRWLALYQSLIAEHAELPGSWDFVLLERYG